MELDKRIKSIDSIRSFNTNNDDCLGKFGYFTNYVTNFDDLNGIRKGICVFKDGSRFPFYVDSIQSQKFQFFIPESELLPRKPKEKSYRPYTLQEFKDKFHIGQPIRFRTKGEKVDEWCSVLVSYWNHQIGNEVITYIFIGPVQYTFDELFEVHEWWDSTTGDWKPFGMEVEE